MLIIFITLILVLLFFVWTVFSFSSLAPLVFVNLLIGWVIVLRAIYDLKSKKKIAFYLLSLSISLIIVFFNIAQPLSLLLNRALVIKGVQFALLVFIMAQLIILADNYMEKKPKKAK
jgi:hypothetical protein